MDWLNVETRLCAPASSFARSILSFSYKYILCAVPVTYIAMIGLAQVIATLLPRREADKIKLGEIDGLRGLLAVSVMMHHYIVWMRVSYTWSSWGPPSINLLNQLGAGSVALFFMATGFVFYPRVLNGFAGNNWFGVLILRVFRIFPLVTLSVLIVSIIAWRYGPQSNISSFLPDALTWVSTYAEPDLFGLHDTGRVNAYVLWSLWYEWVFYLCVLPAASLAMDLLRGQVPTWTVPLGLGLGSVLLKKFGLPGQILTYLPLFSIGMLAYEAQRRETIRELLTSRLSTIVAVLLLFFAMVASGTPYGWSMPLFGIFVICVACGNSMLGVLHSRGAELLGRISFSIYLLHGAVEYCFFTEWRTTSSVNQAILLLPVIGSGVVAVALLSYSTVEEPMMILGKRLMRILFVPGSISQLRRSQGESKEVAV